LPTPYDVPASIYIERLAKYIKDNVDQVQPPPWTSTVKTSSHTTRQPESLDWWFTRAASILRKAYIHGPIGIEQLRAEYGGRHRKGHVREHVRKGGGGNIRKILQQLESAGLIEKTKSEGRAVSREGRRRLDKLAADIKEQLEKTQPELKKYP
jgi:small subunit ribosomal protein S19e